MYDIDPARSGEKTSFRFTPYQLLRTRLRGKAGDRRNTFCRCAGPTHSPAGIIRKLPWSFRLEHLREGPKASCLARQRKRRQKLPSSKPSGRSGLFGLRSLVWFRNPCGVAGNLRSRKLFVVFPSRIFVFGSI